MIEKQDFSAAQKFIEDNKDQLGEYFDRSKDSLMERADLTVSSTRLKACLMENKHSKDR